MLQPKKTKYRRSQKGRAKGCAQRGNQLAFGSFGIKSLGTKWITGRQIEAETSSLSQNRINHSISPLDNPSSIKEQRRTIARLKTELRQRELNNNEA